MIVEAGAAVYTVEPGDVVFTVVGTVAWTVETGAAVLIADAGAATFEVA